MLYGIFHAVCGKFALYAVSRAAHAGAVRAAALDHEAGYNAVEYKAVIEALVCKA